MGFCNIINTMKIATISTIYYVSIGLSSITIFNLLGVCFAFFWIYSEFKKIMGEPVECLLSNKETLKKIERDVFHEICLHKLNLEIMNGKVLIDCNEALLEVDLHAVKVNSLTHTSAIKRRPIVFIHGMNTGPIYFRNILHLFAEDASVDIYLLALPGFGLVDFPSSLLGGSPKNILDFYSSYLKEVFTKLFADCVPDVVGHSFGAFLSGYFYSNNPTLIRSLVIVNGIGLVTYTGNYGKHWSIFFGMGVPLFFTRPFGNELNLFFEFLAEHVFSVKERNANLFFLLSTTCQKNCSDIIFSKFFTTNYINSFFKYPIGNFLFAKGLNISFV
jgi:hypothetical protein